MVQISILKILIVANFYIANFPLTGRLAKLSVKYIGGTAKWANHVHDTMKCNAGMEMYCVVLDLFEPDVVANWLQCDCIMCSGCELDESEIHTCSSNRATYIE